jgi:hypothetical protein
MEEDVAVENWTRSINMHVFDNMVNERCELGASQISLYRTEVIHEPTLYYTRVRAGFVNASINYCNAFRNHMNLLQFAYLTAKFPLSRRNDFVRGGRNIFFVHFYAFQEL